MILNFSYLPLKIKYNKVCNFYENKAGVKLNGKWGVYRSIW